MMWTMMLAVLVPGLPMEEQPHLPERDRQAAAVVAELQEAMATAAAATASVLEPTSAISFSVNGLRYGVGEPWATLADCESGDWEDGGRSFAVGSARWDWPVGELPPWGTTAHHGGLQFAPSTWSWVAPMVGLGHIEFAYEATPEEQVTVARRVQELQGWRAWPVCSRKVGLR